MSSISLDHSPLDQPFWKNPKFQYGALVVLIIAVIVIVYFTVFYKKSKSTSPSPLPPVYPNTTPPVYPNTTPPCVYSDNWVNVGGCSQECGGGQQGQMRQGVPSNCKEFRTVNCNMQSCPPNIPDGIYKSWHNSLEDGTSIVFNRNNSVVYQNCIDNYYNCIISGKTMKAMNGSISGSDNNKVTVNYNNGTSSVYQYNSDNTITDLSNGIVYNQR